MSRQQGNRTIRRLLRSYLLIGLLPMLTLMVIYSFDYVQRANEREQLALEQKVTDIQLDLDHKISYLNSLSAHFSDQLEQTVQLEDVAAQLNVYRQNTTFVEEVLFYSKEDNELCSSSTISSMEQLEGYLGTGVNLMLSNFYQIALTSQQPWLFTLKSNGMESVLDQPLLYSVPMPLYASQSEGTLFYLMQSDLLSSVFAQYLGETEGAFCVLNEYNQMVFGRASQRDSASREWMDTLASIRGTGVFEAELEGEPFVVARTVSEELDYKYLIAIPRYSFYRPFLQWIGLLALVLGGLALIVVVAALWISWLQYRPLRVMLNAVGVEQWEGMDEYQAVVHRYRLMEAEQKRLSVQLDRNSAFMRGNVISRLLNGRLRDIGYAMQCASLQFSGNQFVVFAFSPCAAGATLDFPTEFSMRFGVAYGTELLTERIFCYIIQLDEVPGSPAERENLAGEVTGFLSQLSKEACICGIGKVVSGLEEINTSFVQAVTVMRTLTPYSPHPFSWYEDSEEDQQEQELPLLSRSPIFLENLARGNRERVREILLEHLRYFSSSNYSLQLLMYFSSDLIHCLERASEKCGCTLASDDIQALLGVRDCYGFCQKAEQLVERSCRQIEQSLKAYHSSLQNEVIEYIHQHFQDSDLSLTVLCDVFSLSRSSVAQIIKKETGCTYMQYITNVRFGYIKNELRQTDRSIGEIAVAAGYQNNASFIRRFREMEGMTPGQYREMARTLQEPT